MTAPTPDAETREALSRLLYLEGVFDCYPKAISDLADVILSSGLVVPLDIAEHVSGECMAAEQECYVLRGQLAERDAKIARLTEELAEASAALCWAGRRLRDAFDRDSAIACEEAPGREASARAALGETKP